MNMDLSDVMNTQNQEQYLDGVRIMKTQGRYSLNLSNITSLR